MTVGRILIGVSILLVLAQFIRPSKNTGKGSTSADLTQQLQLPVPVAQVLNNACYDCHSNHTRYPWYAEFQPFGWWLAHHIKEGKAELNFSSFGTYSRRKKISKLNGIANSVKDKTMPLKSYTIMHGEARLSKEQRDILIQWASENRDSLRQKSQMERP